MSIDVPSVILATYPTATIRAISGNVEVCDGRIARWEVLDSDGQPVPRPTEADLAAAAASPEYAAHMLRQAQDARALEVDRRTEALMAQGFEFPPGSGMLFSLHSEAQNYWNALMVAAVAGILEYPVTDIGIIGDGTISLANAQEVGGFCLAAMTRGKAIASGGAAVKRLIYAATTPEAVAAVVDGRE